MDDRNASPLNPLPMVVWIIVLPMIAMEVVLSLGSAGVVGGPGAIGWRLEAFQRFAFAPEYLRQMVAARAWPWDGLVRIVSYPLVSYGATQTVFVVVITLAIGKYVGEHLRGWAILVLFLAGVIGGALAYAAAPMTSVALIGGYPGTYALIGAFTYVLWRKRKAVGQSQLGAFQLIGVLMGFRLLFGVGMALIYGSQASTGLDWIAELAGFAIGFLMSFVVSPGGWQHLRERLRGR